MTSTHLGLQFPQEPGLAEMTLFYCSGGQQTELSFEKHFSILKEKNVDNEKLNFTFSLQFHGYSTFLRLPLKPD